MKKYQIYGIGAALVDTEVEVSDSFLSTENISKGVMTLVNEERQSTLLQALESAGSRILRKCGGSVCNSVVAASSLGSKSFFSGKVADDTDGDLYISDLHQAGIDFHRAGQQPGITGKCLVMVTQDAERTMNTFLGASETLSEREIDQTALIDSEWLYIEGYLVTDEDRMMTARRAIEIAKKNGVKVAVSLSDPFVVAVFGDALREIIGDGVDLIFCNREEALGFSGTNNLEDAAVALQRYSRTFAITDGGNGAITYDGNLLEYISAIETVAIDTNGAGDMFAGAFLYAISSGHNYAWAAKFANAASARVVSQFGPRIEPVEYDRLKQQLNIN